MILIQTFVPNYARLKEGKELGTLHTSNLI